MSQQIKSIKIKFDKYVHETDRAYLVRFMRQEIWLPKKLCRGFAVYGNDMHGVVSIPTFLYEKITGTTVDEEFSENHDESDWIVTKHKPAKIEAITNSQPNENLIR